MKTPEDAHPSQAGATQPTRQGLLIVTDHAKHPKAISAADNVRYTLAGPDDTVQQLLNHVQQLKGLDSVSSVWLNGEPVPVSFRLADADITPDMKVELRIPVVEEDADNYDRDAVNGDLPPPRPSVKSRTSIRSSVSFKDRAEFIDPDFTADEIGLNKSGCNLGCSLPAWMLCCANQDAASDLVMEKVTSGSRGDDD